MRGSAAFRTGVAPGGALAGPWVRDPLWTRARAVPSLDLRFADNKSLVDATTGQNLVTFTRASSGTFVGSNGLLQSAANDAPRFDHNPTTGESLGLLVEEQRTNNVTNNTMAGAVAGTPGTNPTSWIYATAQSNGLTISIVGTGVENGINYIDYRFNGTTVASPNACAIGIGNTSAATAQTWTASTYWKLAAGSTAGIVNWQLGIIEGTTGNVFITGAFYTQTAPTSAALITQRAAATRTLSGGVTVGTITFPINITVAGNTAIDFTLRIGLPQLEQGAFATSPILTSTAAATRSADVASITGSAFTGFYRQDEGVLYWEGVIGSALPSGNFGQFFDFRSDGLNRLSLFWNPTTTNNVGLFSQVSGVSQANTVHSLGTGIKSKLSGAYKINDFASSLNGNEVQTDAIGTVPTVNVASIGSAGGGSVLGQQRIYRLCYWPTRLGNQVLQSITQ